MSKIEYFPNRPDIHPTIYAYEDISYKGLLKVGYTGKDAETRVAQQYPTKRPGGKKPYKIVYSESAMRPDGSIFTDHAVHRMLEKKGILREGGEWFRCGVNDVRAAVIAVKNGTDNAENRTQTFKMRPEQEKAVNRTAEYFREIKKEEPDRSVKFLWNAKMRFGKTFAAYRLCKKMNFKRVLVLTFKPAVESAWHEDLASHVDFEGWQFISNKDARNNNIDIDKAFENADKSRPIVVFGSFQDLLGTNKNGGIKAKNEFIHTSNWDIVIFDEYHFGAWRENAKKLFANFDEEANADFDIENYQKEEAGNAYNETFLPITTNYYLYLSGTPFRALYNGEFNEEQIYSWTYSDEQKAKEQWHGENNPYLSLPQMVMLTYKMPEDICAVAQQGEFDEFDLNVFFSAKGEGKNARFKYENEVQKWLDLIRGEHLPSNVDDLKLGRDKRPKMPYSDITLRSVLLHTVWFLPNVASCYAMRNLLEQRQNTFYHDYTINVCAGKNAGVGLDAVTPVRRSMSEPLKTKTITLTCGKLTTGVTVKPWTGIFMLRNMKSPETYFQAAFRVQSPWTVKDENGKTQILKKKCYVFDFAINRALRQISEYSSNLNLDEPDPEKKLREFIRFLPVLAYDGSSMLEYDAEKILDFSITGTAATLLARRWESALLVNVDNDTLKRLMANQQAIDALMKIEGFRSMNSGEIEKIINKSESIKKAKAGADEFMPPKQKKELSEAEKEYKSKRKKIQEKLQKFATRIPIFMYLTDEREKCLKDVITDISPKLFEKVTGLNVKDFELLCSIGVFNSSLMNEAIYQFKRYEDSSLDYLGIDMHKNDRFVGGYDTSILKQDYERLYYAQQASIEIVNHPAAPAAEKKQPINRSTVYKEKPIVIEKANKTMPVFKPQPKPEKPNEDLPKVEVGTRVEHKLKQQYGVGIVTKIDKGGKDCYIYVKFKAGEKMFGFPDAFKQGFLKLI